MKESTPLNVKPVNSFKKDVRLMECRGKDISKLDTIVRKLARRELLDRRYCDHALTGNWKGHRDCHIESDWVLIYRIEGHDLILKNTGTHSDLGL